MSIAVKISFKASDDDSNYMKVDLMQHPTGPNDLALFDEGEGYNNHLSWLNATAMPCH